MQYFNVECTPRARNDSFTLLLRSPTVLNSRDILIIDGMMPHSASVVLKRPGGHTEAATQLLWGSAQPQFSLRLDNWSGGMELGLLTDGVIEWTHSIRSTPLAAKVEIGAHGWLFLGNDSNRSVDQYTGRRPLSESELNDWRNYFSVISTLENSRRFLFLVVPNKEFVFPDFYPHQQGKTPTHQLLREVGSDRLLWPLDALTAERELSYWKGDTHLTNHGAHVVARELLSALEIPQPSRWDNVRYKVRHAIGDLGNKLMPPLSHPLMSIDISETGVRTVFFNQINNHGKIHICEDPESSTPHTCVVFGDSFSGGLIIWLTKVFRRLVFVHSAAAIDHSIIQTEQPEFVILQSNSRFLISPASPDFSVRDQIAQKIKLMDESAICKVRNTCSGRDFQHSTFYRNLMSEALLAAGTK